MKAGWKRWRFRQRARDLEASLFCMGGYRAWQRVRRENDVMHVWEKRWPW